MVNKILGQLPVATTVADANRLLARQSGQDKWMPYSVVKNAIIAAVNSAAVAGSTLTRKQDTALAAGPVGSNIITRSLSEKLDDIRSVKDFGAVGDGVTDDTDAITAAFFYAVNPSFNRWAAAPGDPSYGVTKGPGIYFPPGAYSYDGPGLDLAGQSSILRLYGDSQQSSRIVIPDGQYFIKSTSNPVGFECERLHFSGGAGALVFLSTAQNVNRLSLVRDCLFTRQTVCAIGHTSQDWPGFRVERSQFRCADTAIAVLMSGLTASGGVFWCDFQGFKYALKLGTVTVAGNDKGPATPLNVVGNSFYRYVAPGGPAFDVWIVPNSDLQEGAGRGVLFTHNKFGNEQLGATDARILIAKENTGSGANATEHPHATTTGGYVRGMTFRDNNVNNATGSASIPFIRSYTGNVEHCLIDDIIEDIQIGPYVEYDAALTANSDFSTEASTNTLSLRRALNASNYAFPDPVSRHGLWLVDDPHGFVALPSVQLPTDGGGMPGDWSSRFTSITATSGMTVASGTGAATTNAIGNIAEGLEVTATASNGRASANFTALAVGRQLWIEGDLQQGSSLAITEVQIEILSGSHDFIRRTYKLHNHWRRFRIGFVPPTTDTFSIRIQANDYSAGEKTKFRVGRLMAYHASHPVDTQARILQNEAAVDPISLAAGAATAPATMTVTGAALGDFAMASFSLDLVGVKLFAAVSAANTVKYWFENETTGVVDLGSGTLRCRVMKA